MFKYINPQNKVNLTTKRKKKMKKMRRNNAQNYESW